MSGTSARQSGEAHVLLELAGKVLAARPSEEGLRDKTPAEREMLLWPFYERRREAQEQAMAWAVSGRLTRDGLQEALEVFLAKVKEHPLVATEAALLAGAATLQLGGPQASLDWALDLGTESTRKGVAGLTAVAVRIVTAAIETGGSAEEQSRRAQEAGDRAHQAHWYDGAVACYELARKALLSLSKSAEAARCDLNLGNVYGEQGQYDLAVACYERARHTFDSLGMSRQAASCDLNLGVMHRNQGRYEPAVASYERARGVFASLGMSGQVAVCDLNLGNVRQVQRRYDEAANCYEWAREAFAALGMTVQVASCDLGLGNVYQVQVRLDEAATCYERAREAFDSLGMSDQVAACDLNLSKVREKPAN